MVGNAMQTAAATEHGPATWPGRVIEHRRIGWDVAIITVQTDQPVPYRAGQYVSVETPQRPRPAKSQRATWPPTVVVGTVPGNDGPKVPLAEDQDAVGEFGSGGQHESFGEASRTLGRDLHGSMPASAQDGVERGGELTNL